MPGRFSKETMNTQTETKPEQRIPLEELQKFYKDHPLGPEFFARYFPNGMKAGLFKTS
jgi:hypothetical protein